MEHLFAVVSLWLGLAVIAAIIAYHLRISIALVEICVGVAATAVAAHIGMPEALGANLEWLRFLASSGAVLLTFLAGAELQPDIIRTKIREVSFVGLSGFFLPFLACAALSYYVLGWNARSSLLSGIVLSTTSMAVIYSVMLETGFNQTAFGKGILGSSFINDFSSVIALGLIFAPFTYKTVIFILASAVVLWILPHLTGELTRLYAFRTAAIRTKWILLVLFSLGALALWAESEAVLPSYLAGMVLAGNAGRDLLWIRRLRTLTVGFLTPFYFLRAGSLVSISALYAAPLTIIILLTCKIASKVFGLFPVISLFRQERNERWYYTLLMSTGLTFGIIAALYGFTHGIITKEQYSYLMAAVIASAVIPTLIAGMAFLPKHLLPAKEGALSGEPDEIELGEEG
jgi:Kef-type K+ transport system membrane component KefB